METTRLRLRPLVPDDAAFLFALLNSPAFLRYIGDRKVHSLAAAERYLRDGPIAAYARDGHGMHAVERRLDRLPVGICGLVRRPGLDDADLGFAFLPEHCGQGYGSESAAAVLRHAREILGLARVVAIVQHDNLASVRLLERLGMLYERDVRLPADPHRALMLYATPCPAPIGARASPR